jgi:K+-sensing histidine kinase KdpD
MTRPPGAIGDADLGERFLSSLAHELRTPLAVVVGYAELLRHRGDETLRAEAAEAIVQASTRLSQAVDDLLVVFALDGECLPVDVQPVELEPVLRQAVERFGEGSATALSAPETWPVVHADEEHLGRVVTDLLRVVSRGAPAGSEVEVAVSADDTSASIAVAGGGLALAPEQLATVFDRPPKQDAQAGGTGLELYKTRRLVELQGGTISATSLPASGSTFTVTLPLADGELP